MVLENLYQLCRRKDYSALRLLLNSFDCKDEQDLLNELKNATPREFGDSMKTCLHYICERGCPPLDLLERLLNLLNASPFSCWSIDTNGNTCLHSLCGGDCDNDNMIKVFRVLLKHAGSERLTGQFSLRRAKQFVCVQNDHGCTALHFLASNSSESGFPFCEVVKEMLALEPNLACITDNEDETPLYYCAQEGDEYPPEVFQILVEACPESVLMQNLSRNLPCDELWKAFCDENSSLVIDKSGFDLNIDNILLRSSCQRLWEKLEIMIISLYQDKFGKRPLHCAVSFPNSPMYMIQLALAFSSHSVYDFDPYGRLPLHVVASIKPHRNSLQIVDILLRENPDAARVKDKDGNIPLYTAISAKNSFQIIDRFLVDPMMLRESHDQTSLVPFMLAATKVSDEITLSTCYKLLLKDPSAIHSFQ